MIRSLVFGATGYTGIELVRLLSAHPDVELVGGSSRQWAGKNASDAFPFISAPEDFPIFSLEDLLAEPQAEVAFLALPHGGSASTIRPLLNSGLKVVDLSADCRLHDAGVYGQWYGEHSDPQILPKAVYGLPEIHRDAIRKSHLVANPGCYPTSAILGIAPLLKRDDVDTTRPIVDSKSGISGAGRGAKLTTSFCETGEGFKPYAVIGHRHIPEMEQELSELAGESIKVRFTPHLIPASRGMVSTIYLPLKADVASEELRQEYERFYSDEPFVRVLPAGSFVDTSYVRGSNLCLIAVEKDERTDLLIVMSAIDNLVKGASGAAVQNMNLIMGLDETAGLRALPMFP